jgi:hypothetical protein
VFDRKELVAHFLHLFLGDSQQLVEPGGDIDFSGFRTGAGNGRHFCQLLLQPRYGGGRGRVHAFKKLRSQPVVLTEQGEEQVFAVNLLVSGLGAQSLRSLKRFANLLSHLLIINHIDLRHFKEHGECQYYFLLITNMLRCSVFQCLENSVS